MMKERDIQILMQDHCTREEAVKHLKNGSIIWENIDELAEEFGVDTEQITAGTVEDLSAVEYQGKTYGISYVL